MATHGTKRWAVVVLLRGTGAEWVNSRHATRELAEKTSRRIPAMYSAKVVPLEDA